MSSATEQKAFVEIEYLLPHLHPFRDGSYEIDYKREIVIVKKYDNRFGEKSEMKVGMFPYGRIKKNPYDTATFNSISFNGVYLIKDTQTPDDDEWEVEKGAEFYNITCNLVFVVSVKDL